MNTENVLNSLLLQTMQRLFKIGDSVSVLDENIKGVVVAITEKSVLIQDENGFEIEYSNSELVRYNSILAKDLTTISKHPIKKKKPTNKKKIKSAIVIDLHHNQATTIKHRILEGQLRKFKMHLNKAIRNRTEMITFIVGVGEGILRKNIESILKKNHIKYSDAPYSKYGNGAVEAHLTGIHKIIK